MRMRMRMKIKIKIKKDFLTIYKNELLLDQ